MTSFFADNIEVNIEEGQWKLFNFQGANSLTPYFRVLRGDGLLHYTSKFSQEKGLPGIVLSAEYVRAVVVGYDEKADQWRLGLYVAMKEGDKPRFVELVHWPHGQKDLRAPDAHSAGRVLAEYLSCPLKLFGMTKPPQPAREGRPAGGVTGPLQPHERVDIDAQRVQSQASQIKLPISAATFWLGATPRGLSLRLPKEAVDKAKGEHPAFTMCVIDKDSQTVRLTPPTGLLGAFLGPQGRALKYQDIRNVELRHSITHESSTQKDSDGLDVDVTTTRHCHGIYLTLGAESLLLARVDYTTTSDLRRYRTKLKAGAGDTKTITQEIQLLKLQQEDEQNRETAEHLATSAAVVIAAALNRTLVKTSISDSIE
jgi:hypothetical protein